MIISNENTYLGEIMVNPAMATLSMKSSLFFTLASLFPRPLPKNVRRDLGRNIQFTLIPWMLRSRNHLNIKGKSNWLL